MSDDRPLGAGDPASVEMITGRPAVLLSLPFTAATVTEVRHALAARVEEAGLTGSGGEDFVLAVHELVTNAVRHGGGSGQLDLRRDDDVLICEVTDQGAGSDDLPVELPAADSVGGRGLWLAHRLTGALLLTRRPDGITATVSVCLSPQTSSVTDSSTISRSGIGWVNPRTEGTQP